MLSCFLFQNVRFDLSDPVKWEYMLPSENQEIVAPDSYEYLDEGEDDVRLHNNFIIDNTS